MSLAAYTSETKTDNKLRAIVIFIVKEVAIECCTLLFCLI